MFGSIVQQLNYQYTGDSIDLSKREPMDLSACPGFDLIDDKYTKFRDFIASKVVDWMNDDAIKNDTDPFLYLSGVSCSGKSKQLTEIAKILRQHHNKAAILISFSHHAYLSDNDFAEYDKNKLRKLKNPKCELIIRMLYGILVDDRDKFDGFRGGSKFDQLYEFEANGGKIEWNAIIDCLNQYCASIRNNDGIVLLIDDLIHTRAKGEEAFDNLDDINDTMYQFLKEIVINNQMKRSKLSVVLVASGKSFMETEAKNHRKVEDYMIPLLDTKNYSKLQEQIVSKSKRTKFDDWPHLFSSTLTYQKRLQDIVKCQKIFPQLTLKIVEIFQLLLRLSHGRPRMVIDILHKYEDILARSHAHQEWISLIHDGANGQVNDHFINYSVDVTRVSKPSRETKNIGWKSISDYLLWGNMIQPSYNINQSAAGAHFARKNPLEDKVCFVPSLMAIFSHMIRRGESRQDEKYIFYCYVRFLFYDNVDENELLRYGIPCYNCQFKHLHCIFEGLKRRMLFQKYTNSVCKIQFSQKTIECIKIKLGDLYPNIPGCTLYSDKKMANETMYLPKLVGGIDDSHFKDGKNFADCQEYFDFVNDSSIFNKIWTFGENNPGFDNIYFGFAKNQTNDEYQVAAFLLN